jgi:hypothetical protein
MRNADVARRCWLMAISDHERQPAFDLMFVTVDPNLAHLRPGVRDAVVTGCRRTACVCRKPRFGNIGDKGCREHVVM